MKALLGVVLAIAGAVAAGYGAFHTWQHGRVGAHIPLADVFSVPGKETVAPATSALLPIGAGIVLVVLGLLRKASGFMFLGGLLILLPVALPVLLGHVAIGDLQAGAWQVASGGALCVVAATLRSG